MKSIKFILAGMVFGIVMTKSEAVSWYRIQEMFRFHSFHMYGIICTAVILGVISVLIIKKFKFKDIGGSAILFKDKDRSYKKYIFGGIIFGLGWALSGACPGPMFVNLGNGYPVVGIVILGALLGTYLYGVFQKKLPH
ncbi:DUF6691 family protein [Pedobacter sp.]|uniref:DUF6691 family protein n=1 Tax=Pedobacter sp. TaxID=1411316 RepID=UPI003BAA5B22